MIRPLNHGVICRYMYWNTAHRKNIYQDTKETPNRFWVCFFVTNASNSKMHLKMDLTPNKISKQIEKYSTYLKSSDTSVSSIKILNVSFDYKNMS